MKEYIVSIAENIGDEYVRFIGAMRKNSQQLIRCKDCKFSSPNGVYGCRIHSFADDLDERLYADDFCSMAERKEE